MSADDGDAAQLLFVRIEDHRFAFRLEEVAEVLLLVEPVPVPGWPRYGLGLIDVRGEVMALVDPRSTLQLDDRKLEVGQKVVVVLAQGRRWGVLVSSVEGVQASVLAPLSEVAPQPRLVRPDVSDQFAQGAAGPVPVVDAARLIDVLGLPPPPEPEAAGSEGA